MACLPLLSQPPHQPVVDPFEIAHRGRPFYSSAVPAGVELPAEDLLEDTADAASHGSQPATRDGLQVGRAEAKAPLGEPLLEAQAQPPERGLPVLRPPELAEPV